MTPHRHRKAKTEGRCTYCGRAAEVWDHVIPWSVGGTTWMVESCSECNHLAYNRSFQSLDEKRGWIKARLERRYWTLLHGEHVAGTREELQQDMLRDRLRWMA